MLPVICEVPQFLKYKVYKKEGEYDHTELVIIQIAVFWVVYARQLFLTTHTLLPY